MMGWNALQVVPAVFLGAWSAYGLLVVFGQIGDWGLRQIEQRRRKTHLRNECPSCRRVETYQTKKYDHDLGDFFVNSFKRCTACEYKHATHGNPLIFDTASWTLEDIRRIDPEYADASAQGGRDAASRDRNASGDGRDSRAAL